MNVALTHPWVPAGASTGRWVPAPPSHAHPSGTCAGPSPALWLPLFFPSVAEVPQAGIDSAFLMGFGSLFKVVAALGLDFFPPFDSRPDEIVNLADFKQLGEGRVIQRAGEN